MFDKINLKEVFSLPFRIYFSVLVGLGLLLFLPSGIIGKLYLDEFLNKYGIYVGFAFIILFSIVVFSIIGKIFILIKNKYSNYKFNRNKDKVLEGLNPNEKAILYLFYKSETNTLYLPYNDGLVAKLRSFFIITPTTNSIITGNLNNPRFPFMMQPWVHGYIDKNYNEYFKGIDLNEEELYGILQNFSTSELY
ncbi:hypothetical protein CIW83_09815 [Tissierella sp. P1]|uniref:super-infection exclusion protein B n=1 Tax=Tissierella sp. P1 TaxID=1280483 RepID=UPI000B9FAD76|nr:super-infection exclusion protein B [Tissierella sp. P1]OZV12381.1 hypothetical protein CIW83_09815 [Tissierella sp. P1]